MGEKKQASTDSTENLCRFGLQLSDGNTRRKNAVGWRISVETVAVRRLSRIASGQAGKKM